MDGLSDKDRLELAVEASSHIIEVCSDNIGRTYTSIQEKILETYPELIGNPYISSSNALITLLITHAKYGALRILGAYSKDKIPILESSFDPKTFQDFVNLGRFTQSCYLLELCGIQAYNDDTLVSNVTQRMNDIFAKTHGYKARLFHLVGPEKLRVYYQLGRDNGRRQSSPSPILETTH